jgi:nucleotide-binding universal stress UspA family protein
MPSSTGSPVYDEIQARYPRLLDCLRWQGILTHGEALSAIAAHRRGDGRYGGSEAVVHYGGADQLLADIWRNRDAIRTIRGHRGHLRSDPETLPL